jgi:hypothetical protein
MGANALSGCPSHPERIERLEWQRDDLLFGLLESKHMWRTISSVSIFIAIIQEVIHPKTAVSPSEIGSIDRSPDARAPQESRTTSRQFRSISRVGMSGVVTRSNIAAAAAIPMSWHGW